MHASTIHIPKIHSKSPVVFIIYNRPEKTKAAFEAIKNYQPEQLYLIADGTKNSDDLKRVVETRNIVSEINWECKVTRLYADENLGCALRVVTGLNEVFETCDKAIIIEDDIIVSPAFFDFCTTMLHHFQDDDKIMTINGTNSWINFKEKECDAFLSNSLSVWGWATWKRSWKKYQFKPTFDEQTVQNQLKTYFNNPFREALILHSFRHKLFERTNDWGFQLALAMYTSNAYALTPSENYIQNIGFGQEGTHFTNPDFRATFPVFTEHTNESYTVSYHYDTSNEKYDLGATLMNIICMYEDVFKLSLLVKNKHLISDYAQNIGWQCQLEPFNHPELILEMIQELEKHMEHPQLTRIKKAFQPFTK